MQKLEAVPESPIRQRMVLFEDIARKIGCTIHHLDEMDHNHARFQILDENEIPISEQQHREIVNGLIRDNELLNEENLKVVVWPNSAVNIEINI